MASKRKEAPKQGKYTIHLGPERTDKIERFRAKRRMKGEVISTIDDAVCGLVDKQLVAEGIS